MNIFPVLILISNLQKIWPQVLSEEDIHIVPPVEEELLKVSSGTKLQILRLYEHPKNASIAAKIDGSAQQGRTNNLVSDIQCNSVELPPEVRNVTANGTFSIFRDDHRVALLRLVEFFSGCLNLEELVRLINSVRPLLNEHLFLAALTNVINNMNIDLELPPIIQAFPGDYIDGSALEVCTTKIKNIKDGRKKRQVNIKDGRKKRQVNIKDGRKKRQVDQNTVTVQRFPNGTFLINQVMDLDGINQIPENRVAYFREDYGMNSHHYNWHLVMTLSVPRRDENFIYMHSQMIRRYNTERLAVGLPRVEPYYDFRFPIEVGHRSNLGNFNSLYGTRYDWRRPVNFANLWRLFEFRRRVENIIRQGIVNDDDFLGLLENYHNVGHVNIAQTVDVGPDNVMGVAATAARDNVFYRWHQHIDDIYMRYHYMQKRVSNSWLTYDELVYNDIQVTNVEVKSNSNSINEIQTGCGYHRVDITKGLAFDDNTRAIVNLIHLDHVPFTYTIKVDNLSTQSRNGVVRIFLATKYNEAGLIMDIQQQRNFWIEMDKFMYTFTPGLNNIVRKSARSSVSVDCRDSFDDIAERIWADRAERTDGHCGCGWPQHLLVPRGTPEGMAFNLFVIVTNEPNIQEWRLARSTYCGLPNRELSDRRPMGFPFHTQAPNNYHDIYEFANALPNAAVSELSIRFTGVQTNKTEEPVEGCGRS